MMLAANAIQVNWIIAHNAGNIDSYVQLEICCILGKGKVCKVRAAIIFPRQNENKLTKYITNLQFHTLKAKVKAERYGAATAGKFIMVIAAQTARHSRPSTCNTDRHLH